MAPRPFPPGPAHWAVEAAGLMRSFWGVFGYLSISCDSGASALQCAVCDWHGRQRVSPPARLCWQAAPPSALMAGVGLVAAPHLWRSDSEYTRLIPSSQGRLLFPAIAAIALLWATGWSTLLSPQVQMRWRQLWLWAPVLFMLLVALWAPWGVIAPAYRQPAPIATLPATAQPFRRNLW